MQCHKASTMRELFASVGGPVGPLENRKGWLRRVARLAGISDRSARAAFYGELRGDMHATGVETKLRAAAERLEAENKKNRKAARDELAELTERVARLERRLVQTDADFFGADISGHRQVLSIARGNDPPE
jgi:hypothetical protein